jgi:hypothetical protein
MKEEEKDLVSQDGDQEDLTESEFGFVYDFFLAEKNSVVTIHELNKKEHKEPKKDKFINNNQSVVFFLPDFFTDED